MSSYQKMKSFAVNVHGPFFMSRLVLEEMIARKSGAIVNISSGAAIGPGRGPYKHAPLRGGTLYGAEKAALERFTQWHADGAGKSANFGAEARRLRFPGECFGHGGVAIAHGFGVEVGHRRHQRRMEIAMQDAGAEFSLDRMGKRIDPADRFFQREPGRQCRGHQFALRFAVTGRSKRYG